MRSQIILQRSPSLACSVCKKSVERCTYVVEIFFVNHFTSFYDFFLSFSLFFSFSKRKETGAGAIKFPPPFEYSSNSSSRCEAKLSVIHCK